MAVWSTPDGLISILRVTPVKNYAAAGRYQTASAGGRVSGCDDQAGRYDYSNPATLFTLSDIAFQLTVITIVWISLPKVWKTRGPARN